jgi:foldase protein PrsA
MRLPRSPAVALALILPAALAAGCGSSVPSSSVATVAGVQITKPTFNHWYKSAYLQQAQQTGAPTPTATPPQPPDFAACVAAQLSQPPQPGTPKPTRASAKQQCQQQYQTLVSSVMRFLITSQWLTSEAARRHIQVSDQEVTQSFQSQKKTAFPHEADYQKYLQQSGQTQADILMRVKLQLIQNKIEAQVVQQATPVTTKEIAAYYAKNKQRFAQPETRDLLVVLTSKQQQANAALAAIRSGQSWAAVAKKYSIDSASKAAGGKLPGVTRGQQEQTFDAAIFSAPAGQLQGPVKTQFGYYVFEVTQIHQASQQSVAQATPTIQNLLRSQHQQAALSAFIKGFEDRYAGETSCAKAYAVAQLCSNANTPKAQPVSGSPPQAPCGVPCGTKPPQKTPAAAPGGALPPGGATPGGATPGGATPGGATPGGTPPGAPQTAPPQTAPPPTGP